MRMFKSFKMLLIAASILAALAIPAASQELSGKNWRVFNINPNVPKYWDINQADNPLGFDFNTVSSGWYTVYLNTNYKQLTGKASISTTANWTASNLYINRSGTPGDAYFRLYFQSAQGNYTSNDYWWSTGTARCDLNNSSSCILTVSLTDRTQWSNLCGQRADDIVPHPGDNCVGGTDPNVSPYDGFTAAKRDVKDLGLSFGRAARYASGVAIDDAFAAPASFHVSSYRVNP